MNNPAPNHRISPAKSYLANARPHWLMTRSWKVYLLKIVHVFIYEIAVLFLVRHYESEPGDASFRARYIIKDSISWENVASADGLKIYHQFA
jgi:hypothetical protein